MLSANIAARPITAPSRRGRLRRVSRKPRVNKAPNKPAAAKPMTKGKMPQVGQAGQRNSLPRPLSESCPTAMLAANRT
jgi:hypothetical protein